jgi:serine/threonine-protein kinase
VGEADDIVLRDLETLEGVELAGRFRLKQMLGRGGYGAVFEAEQTSVRRRCAVKVLVPGVASDPRNTRRFEREARATSQLAHPNTVVTYDFGLDEERQLLFLAMEFIEGESLRELIRREGTLELGRTLWIVHQTARSLQDAHDRGLVHRDVKPHNIMLTERGGNRDFVKVIDFGIAKFLDSKSVRESIPQVTVTGMVVGTPSYMAPEQVRNAALDGRTDQYALATCVYQMLTGRTVFTGESPVDIATRQLTRRPIPIRTLNPSLEVSAEFEQTLLKALEKEPADRFDSIREFADRLFEVSGVTPPYSMDTGEQRRDPSEAPTESIDFDAPGSQRRSVHDRTTEPDAVAPTASLPEMVDATAETVGLRSVGPDDQSPTYDEETASAELLDARMPDLGPAEQARGVEPADDVPPSDDVPGNTLAVDLAQPDDWTLGDGMRTVPDSSPDVGGNRGVRVVAALAVAVAAIAAFVGFAMHDETPQSGEGSSEVASVQEHEVDSVVEAAAPENREDAPDAPARAGEPTGTDEPLPSDTPQPERRGGDTPRPEPDAPESDEPKSPAPESSPEPEPPQGIDENSDMDGLNTSDEPANTRRPRGPRTGRVTVTLVPWGELWVDGKPRGSSGRTRLTLSAGKHRLELRQNGVARASKTVDVRPGQSKIIELIAR